MRWVVIAHGIVGLGIVVLAPWKSTIARRGLQRRRPGRGTAIAFAGLILTSIGAALVVQLEDYLSGAGFIGVDMVIGAVFVLVVLLFRRGIWGTAEQVWAAVSRRRSPALPGGTSPGEVGPAEQRDTVDAGRVDAGREVT